LAEKDEPLIVVAVPNTARPPPRPLPPVLTPAPPVAKLLLMLVPSITSSSRPVAKTAPPSPTVAGNPLARAAPPTALLKLK
jgi:hypothetical protein